MSFVPVLPGGGIAGWQFLRRTYDAQRDAFAAAPQLERDTAHFRKTIAQARTAADLVADRRLLSVALGAFGLSDDLNNRFFIRKILEEGTGSRDALANRLTDIRYRRLSGAFGFGPGETVRTGDPSAMTAISEQSLTQAFEIAVGQQDETMRIALFAQRELSELAARPVSDDTKWYSMMGLPPLRALFETALGLPAAFGRISIENQLRVFRDKAQSATGVRDFAGLAKPEVTEKLTRLYLARAQIGSLSSDTSSAGTALTLLRSQPAR